ncbi:hypothetical protein GW17_00000953 [Ensete ventricosum]|nr:hypothetical protein GW17_00000953 [Ensete ventricosum]RZS12161.1 hypothetical protein BHM03_00043581 [Ensete ventricosum]
MEYAVHASSGVDWYVDYPSFRMVLFDPLKQIRSYSFKHLVLVFVSMSHLDITHPCPPFVGRGSKSSIFIQSLRSDPFRVSIYLGLKQMVCIMVNSLRSDP